MARAAPESRRSAKLPILTLADILQTTPLRTLVRAPIVAISANWHECYVDIYKIKLPAGLSYVLKPSRLEGAILDAGIRLPVSLHQQHKVWAVSAPALSADFQPRGSYIGGDDGHFSVTSCAIPSSERKIQQDFAERIFLPALVAWMTSIEALPPDSTIRREEQFFTCEGAPVALAKRALATSPKGQRRRKRA